MLNSPSSITADATYLYVPEGSGYRIDRFVQASGAFAGWTGNISSSPTGGEVGCNGAPAAPATPGWCTGGTAATGTGDGKFSGLAGIAIDSAGNIYVAEGTSQPRISRISPTGAFTGWIGKITGSPTAGDPGCLGATGFTPGWCLGGSTASNGAGGASGFNSAQGVQIDSTNNFLYVTDTAHTRVIKHNLSTGAYIGWRGKVQTAPTGGDAGCVGAPVGSPAPGWCTGGLPANDYGEAMFSQPWGMAADASYLYIVDYDSHRLNRIAP